MAVVVIDERSNRISAWGLVCALTALAPDDELEVVGDQLRTADGRVVCGKVENLVLR